MELSSRYTAITEAAARVLGKPMHQIEVFCVQCRGFKETKPCPCDDIDRMSGHSSDGLHDACKDAYKRAHA